MTNSRCECGAEAVGVMFDCGETGELPVQVAPLEKLVERFNTVGVFYHDAYVKWQVVADGRRVVFEDCTYVGWGDTLGEAICNLLEHARREA